MGGGQFSYVSQYFLVGGGQIYSKTGWGHGRIFLSGSATGGAVIANNYIWEPVTTVVFDCQPRVPSTFLTNDMLCNSRVASYSDNCANVNVSVLGGELSVDQFSHFGRTSEGRKKSSKQRDRVTYQRKVFWRWNVGFYVAKALNPLISLMRR